MKLYLIISLLIAGFTKCHPDHGGSSNGALDPPDELFSDSGSESGIGCPELSDLPNTIKFYGNNRILCARFYSGFGGKYPVNSCNGNHYDIPDDYTLDAGKGYFYPMGSILVKPGCDLYLFESTNLGNGNSHQYSTGRVFNNPFWNQNPKYPAGPRSFACSCQHVLPNCTATDKWETVVTCDNSDNLENSASCSFTAEVGATLHHSITRTLSISRTIAVEIAATFGRLFRKQSSSLTTGYDFSASYDFSRTTTNTISVDTTVAPGFKLAIEQANGHCGGSKFNTNMFRIIQQDQVGEKERTNIEFF